MKKHLVVLSLLVLVPVLAHAQSIDSAMSKIAQLLGMVVPILIVLAVIYFIWGVIKYVVSGDEESKAKGRTMIIYGIIGLAVIVGVWGLVNLLLNTFGLGQGGTVVTPTLPIN